jgi:hypothetical protein
MIVDGRTITGILRGIEKYPMIGDIDTTTMSGAAGLGTPLASTTEISIIIGVEVIGAQITDWVAQDLPDLRADRRFMAAAGPAAVPRGLRYAPSVLAAVQIPERKRGSAMMMDPVAVREDKGGKSPILGFCDFITKPSNSGGSHGNRIASDQTGPGSYLP